MSVVLRHRSRAQVSAEQPSHSFRLSRKRTPFTTQRVTAFQQLFPCYIVNIIVE